MSLSWYVLHSKPSKEDFLFSQLQHRDIEVYYPRLRVEPVNPRSRKVRPFFPGYIFVKVDLEKTLLSSLAYVPGVNRIVSFDQKPAIVPEEFIQTIIQNVERINENPDMKYNQLQHGDPVIIQGGLFEGYEAIFDTRLKAVNGFGCSSNFCAVNKSGFRLIKRWSSLKNSQEYENQGYQTSSTIIINNPANRIYQCWWGRCVKNILLSTNL